MSDLLSHGEFIELYDSLASKEVLGPSPVQGSRECDHTLLHTIHWLQDHHIQDTQLNVEKKVDLGGHCDCEVLLNVDPDTWEERREEDITGPDLIGEQEWQRWILDSLRKGGYNEAKKYDANVDLQVRQSLLSFPLVRARKHIL